MTEQSQVHPIVAFKRDLTGLIERKELALPSTVSMDAFRNAAIVAVQDNPSILQCEKSSVFRAIRRLAASGLVPDGREAAIVPFKGKAQAMPMVAGIIKTARNSGEIASLWADVIYEGERIEVWIEDGERKWNHVQENGNRIDPITRGGDVIGAYAVAKLKDGTVDFEPMGKAQIEKRRKASASQKSDQPTGVWKDWYDEMTKKTVIRALAKRLPMSSDDARRIMVEGDAQDPGFKDVTPTDEPPRRNLADKILSQEPDHQPEDETQDQPETIEGTAFEFDDTAVDPFADEYTEGVKASTAGMKEHMNPGQTFEDWNNWLGGFRFHQENKDMANG